YGPERQRRNGQLGRERTDADTLLRRHAARDRRYQIRRQKHRPERIRHDKFPQRCRRRPDKTADPALITDEQTFLDPRIPLRLPRVRRGTGPRSRSRSWAAFLASADRRIALARQEGPHRLLLPAWRRGRREST